MYIWHNLSFIPHFQAQKACYYCAWRSVVLTSDDLREIHFYILSLHVLMDITEATRKVMQIT